MFVSFLKGADFYEYKYYKENLTLFIVFCIGIFCSKIIYKFIYLKVKRRRLTLRFLTSKSIISINKITPAASLPIS